MSISHFIIGADCMSPPGVPIISPCCGIFGTTVGMRRASSASALNALNASSANVPLHTVLDGGGGRGATEPPAYEIFVSGPVAGVCRLMHMQPATAPQLAAAPLSMPRSISAGTLHVSGQGQEEDDALVDAAACLATPPDNNETESRTCNVRSWLGGGGAGEISPELHKRFLRTRRRRRRNDSLPRCKE